MEAKNTYNGKTSLTIDYQWEFNNGINYDDITILSATFDTLDEAYKKMTEVMPYDCEADDGFEFEEWNYLLAIGDEDVFLSFNAQVDDSHNFLAYLRPATE